VSDAKKGAKDISDLKQRLGLKKTGGGAPAPASTTSGTGANPRIAGPNLGPGGVVAPPGMNLPPPPGLAPPTPVAPPPPRAEDDPFGAMNHMAAVGTVQRAPEIVIVNDGKPVENVGSQSTGATIAKIAVPALIALVVGVAVGKIGSGGSQYNEGIDGAKATLQAEKDLKKNLADLDAAFDAAKSQGYHPDKKLDDAIKKAAAALEIKANTYALARNITLEGDLAGQVLALYGGASELKSMADNHVKSAKSDEQQFVAAKASLENATAKESENKYLGATGSLRYGVVVTAPASCSGDSTESKKDCEAAFGANFVEIGGPICQGSKIPSASGVCEGGLAGFAYRTEPGSPAFATADIVLQGNDSVPSKKILPLIPNGVLDSFVKKNADAASELLYKRRVLAMADMTKKLIESANNLEKGLSTFANSGKRFTFFM